jgi:hypothetical protein
VGNSVDDDASRQRHIALPDGLGDRENSPPDVVGRTARSAAKHLAEIHAGSSAHDKTQRPRKNAQFRHQLSGVTVSNTTPAIQELRQRHRAGEQQRKW